MAINGGRMLPHISVRLFDPGEGDPRVTDHGFAWLDLLANPQRVGPGAGGVIERNIYGYPLLELLPEIGLTCAARLVMQDTRDTHWTTGGGIWQEMLLPTGSPRVWRMAQLSGTDGAQWSAESSGTMPEGPNFALSLTLPDTPPDWDSTALEPYVQVAFGDLTQAGHAWAVRFLKDSTLLLRFDGTSFLPYATLPNPARGAGYSDGNEVFLWVRCLAGRLLISTSNGYDYQPFGSDVDPVVVGAGTVVVSGQGGQCVFGLHQLALTEGDYLSRERDTLTNRVSYTGSITGREYLPAGTSASYTDTGGARIAQYRATLTPASSTWGPGWAVYRAPVVASVTYYIAPSYVAGTGTYTTPWDGKILSWDITKPEALGESEATLEIKIDAGSTWSGGYRRRKVLIELGYRDGVGGSLTSFTAFIGYIRRVGLRRDSYGNTIATLTIGNVTDRLRRQQWTELQVRSLAGFTVNEASDYLLLQFGVPLDPSYRQWHAWGNVVLLADGGPANPCELIRPGESPWETLQRIQSYARLEVGVTDDGALVAVPYRLTTGVSHDIHASDTNDLQELSSLLENTLDYDETGTAVLVAAEDAAGERVWAWAVDTEAEFQPLSDRYCPWRELVQDQVFGACTLAMLNGRVQLLAQRTFGLIYLVDTDVFLHEGISRRDSAFLYGFGEQGIPDGTEHIVMAMRNRGGVNRDGAVEMRTELGLQRL